MNNSTLVFWGIVVAVMWGLNPILKKSLLNDFCPQTVMLVINMISIVCLMIYSLRHREKIVNDMRKVNEKHMMIFVLSAIASSFLSTLIYYNILSKRESSMVILLTSMSPIFGMFFAQWILEEEVNIEMYFVAIFLSLMIWRLTAKPTK